MSWGQIAEMAIMLLVPIALTRYGAKWAITAGLGALVVRYVAFLAGGTLGQDWLYYIAILIHGAIFGFLIVGGQVYVDKKAPPEIKAQAQGLVGLLLFGVGMLIGTFASEFLINMYTTETMVENVMIWDWLGCGRAHQGLYAEPAHEGGGPGLPPQGVRRGRQAKLGLDCDILDTFDELAQGTISTSSTSVRPMCCTPSRRFAAEAGERGDRKAHRHEPRRAQGDPGRDCQSESQIPGRFRLAVEPSHQVHSGDDR